MKAGGLNPGRSFLVLAAVCEILGGPRLQAQASRPSEYQVKAAYLSNFGRFVEWPARPAPRGDEPFNICVLGEDPFGVALDAALSGETIDRGRLVAMRIQKPLSASGCRVLFISSSEESQLKEILAALATTSVLTVSDMPQFVKRGGMIQFLVDSNRVRFEVNLTAAQRAGLTLSSELLKLAIAVRRAP